MHTTQLTASGLIANSNQNITEQEQLPLNNLRVRAPACVQHVAKLRPSQTPAPSCTSTSTGSSGHQQPAASSTAPPQQTPPPSSTDTSSSGPRQPTGEVWAGVAEFYLFAGYGDDTERFQMVSDSYDGVVSAFDQEADRDRYSGYNILNIWKVEPKSGDS